jgi:hypothetical protein
VKITDPWLTQEKVLGSESSSDTVDELTAIRHGRLCWQAFQDFRRAKNPDRRSVRKAFEVDQQQLKLQWIPTLAPCSVRSGYFFEIFYTLEMK